MQLNASDDRGIDVVREQIKSFAGTRKLFSTGVKLVVLDEADAMTSDAQFALRRGGYGVAHHIGLIPGVSLSLHYWHHRDRLASPALRPSLHPRCFPAVIEKYARNTRFCLICNYVSKIIPALQSRCTRFRFAPLESSAIRSRLSYIVDKEGLTARLSPEGEKAVLQLGGGDMRKVLNILQSAASGYDTLDEDAVYAVTGNPRPQEIKETVAVLLRGTFQDGYKREWRRSGAQLQHGLFPVK